MNTEKLISFKYKFVYFCVPKAATRSLLTALYRNPQHDYECIECTESNEDLFKKYPSIKDFYKFTFVRNPWSRIVSCYENKINNPDINVQRAIVSLYKRLRTGMTFPHFVAFLNCIEGSDKHADRHWISQHKILSLNNQMIEFDYIGKMENIEFDLNKIMDDLKLPHIDLPMLNTRFGWNSDKIKEEKEKYKYREYYNIVTENVIKDRYRKDIKLFKYSF